jgi:hypothetical protein
MRRLSRRGAVLLVAVALIAVAGAGTVLADPGGVFGGGDNSWPYDTSAGPSAAVTNPVLVAVGDIACEPDNAENSGNPAAVKCGGTGIGGQTAEFATAQQAYSMTPDLVAIIGDEQYRSES